MSETRGLTCIRCPRGCQLVATIEGRSVTAVTGNACPRGAAYAADEVCHPMRCVTTTVAVTDSPLDAVVSVRTDWDVPKEKIADVVAALATVRLEAPVHVGDLVLADVCGTGVNVVATREA